MFRPHPNGGSHASIITCMHMQIIGWQAEAPVPLYAPIARCSRQNAIHAISAAIGIVSTHAHMILVAMPQRTAFSR